ncbi:MAG: 5'/3'-nucleotidase SurE [Planctomycetota bacterium]
MIVTNDDGFDAPGIQALAEAAGGLGDLVVVAPQDVQSGVGHQVTAYDAFPVVREGEVGYRIGGTPADCVRVALAALEPEAGWVLSGINDGANLGVDVFTSGTVAAAREAAFHGRRALAISQYFAQDRTLDWSLVAARARAVLDVLVEIPIEPGQFWNVNLPHVEDASAALDLVFCRVDPSPHGLGYEVRGEVARYTSNYHDRPRRSGFDTTVCFEGAIAVTLLQADGQSINPEPDGRVLRRIGG